MRIRQQIGEVSGTIFTNAFVFVCCSLFPSIYDIRWRGLENYRAAPSTLITIGHKRDTDIVIMAPWMHLKRTLFHNHLRMHFFAREDLFQPGFLNYHFKFRFLRGPVINRLNVAPFIRGFRAHPICHIVHKRVAPLMRDVLNYAGDMKLGDTLSQTCLEEFASQLPGETAAGLSEIRISTFLGSKYRRLHDDLSDSGILKNGLSRELRTRTLKRIGQQIDVFAGILDDGGICMVAPEGDLSKDGYFSSVKSGIHRLLSRTRNGVIIQPVYMTYDFMTRKRMTIYVDIGKEFQADHRLNRTDLENRVQSNIVSQGRVTMGQLGSEYLINKLVAGDDKLITQKLRETIAQRTLELKTAGFKFDDRLLSDFSFEKRLDDFINYCIHADIITRRDSNGFVINRAVNSTEGDFRRNPVGYSYNELKNILQSTAVSTA